jgi:hypothetical protein
MTACPKTASRSARVDVTAVTLAPDRLWILDREWEDPGMRPLFGAVGLSLFCVVSGDDYGFFLVRAGFFKTKRNIRKL